MSLRTVKYVRGKRLCDRRGGIRRPQGPTSRSHQQTLHGSNAIIETLVRVVHMKVVNWIIRAHRWPCESGYGNDGTPRSTSVSTIGWQRIYPRVLAQGKYDVSNVVA